MIKIAPGVYQLRLPIPDIPLEYVNAYLVEGDKDNGYLLVDTGWNTEKAFASLKKQLAEIGISFKDISKIIITHAHPDHYGLAGRLKRLCRAQVYLHKVERDIINSRYIDMDKLLQQTAQELRDNGAPQDELAKLQTASLPMLKFVNPVLPDVALYGGETITTGYFNFKVIWAPGHSPGQICLYEPEKKILFSGDHILPTITPHVGRHPQSGDNPLGDYLNSLNSLKKLEVRLVLPGHEHPFTDLKARIEELIQHHQRRNLEILETLNTRAKTAYKIATEITWMSDAKGVGWDKLGHWDRRMAVLETLSHLEAMRVDRGVDKFSRNGIIYYRQRRRINEQSKTNQKVALPRA